MKLNELPVNAIYAVALSSYLICIAGIYCTVRAFGIPEQRLNAALSLLFTLPGLAFSSILAQYLNLTRKNRTIPDLTTDLLRLPLPCFLILAAVCSAAIAVIYARVRRSMRETISAQSVCEGLDQLSDGICYSMPDGFPQLVNNKMQQISAAAFGIENILCLTGDHTKLGDHPGAKPVFDLDSVSLLHTVRLLESGKDLGGNDRVVKGFN